VGEGKKKKKRSDIKEILEIVMQKIPYYIFLTKIRKLFT
jgi:hypothetical protein